MSENENASDDSSAGEGDEGDDIEGFPKAGIMPPGATFNPRELRLPNGQVIDLSDWVNADLRSALIIDPWSTGRRWELFSYGRAQKVVGTNVTATRVHTNVPRAGEVGLPRDWEMHVLRWRAQSNVQLEQAVIDWAAETHVQFAYNDKFYGDATMLDLLLHPQPMGDPLPIHMRENLQYGVTVETDSAAMATFRDWLRGGDLMATQSVRDAVVELDTIIRLRGEADPIVPSLRHVQAKLAAGRTMLLWVHLEGPIRRVVV